MDIAIGLLIGVAIGTTGVGGGTITAPILVLLMGYSPRAAVATALVYAASVKLWAAMAFVIRKQVNLRVLGFLLLGGLPGAVLGTLILNSMKAPSTSDWVLSGVGAVVLISAVSSLVDLRSHKRAEQGRCRFLPLLAFPIGVESGFSSSGSGALGTVILLRFTTLSPAEVVGTGLAFGVGICGIAGLMQAVSGNCDLSVLMRMIPAGWVGSMIGVFLCSWIPVRALRNSLLVGTAGIGLTLLIKGLGGIF